MATRGSHHQKTGRIRPQRTAFDLSFEKKFTCDFAELIPVFHQEVVPGDFIRMGYQMVGRTQPMFSPLLHEVKATIHSFFVPYRLLWDNWENFISGGPDGNYTASLPRWPQVGQYRAANGSYQNVASSQWLGKRSYWDYYGFPLHVSEGNGAHWSPPDQTSPSSGSWNTLVPLAFLLRAQNFIWEEYYRDENFQARCNQTTWSAVIPTNRDKKDFDYIPNAFSDRPALPYLRNWTKDYFTSALPFQQRGDAPAFPVTGNISVDFDNTDTFFYNGVPGYMYVNPSIRPVTQPDVQIYNVAQSDQTAKTGQVTLGLKGSVDLTSNAITFNVKDLRWIVQLQRWMERNARGGVRYTEFLRAHFDVAPSDERLNRPEYIGGAAANLVVSEVLQTSGNSGSAAGTGIDSTPQGNMSGHGMMAASGRIGKYFVKEYGLILTFLSIMPTPSYEDGIHRMWMRRVNTDFYFPEFAHLSEQAIRNSEIYANGTAVDDNLWGYQPQYDEMRINQNIVCGEFRNNSSNNLAFWHLGRHFSTLPSLSSNFVRCTPTQFNRCFAVGNFQHFIITFGNVVKAIRPLPFIGEPGLVDHF